MLERDLFLHSPQHESNQSSQKNRHGTYAGWRDLGCCGLFCFLARQHLDVTGDLRAGNNKNTNGKTKKLPTHLLARPDLAGAHLDVSGDQLVAACGIDHRGVMRR